MTAATSLRGARAGRPFARLAAGTGLLLLLVALLLAPAGPASAHAVLASSSPAASAVVTSAPAEVVLTFTEAVRKVPDKIRVIAPDGSRADRGEPVFDGGVVTVPVDPDGRNGTYLVSYRVISADSHPVSGAFTYSVGAPSTPPVDAGADGQADPAVGVTIKVAKYLSYAGLLLLVGPVLMVSVFWPCRLSRSGPSRVAWLGLALVAVGTLLGIWAQVPYTAGGALTDVDGGGLRDVLSSDFGLAHLVRLGLLAASAFLLRPVLAGHGGRSDRVILAVLGGAALLTWPLAGHPAASPAPPLSIFADAVHLGSMAVWLGGLVVLAGFLLRRAEEDELAAILPVWSRWAAFAVVALLLAGTVNALIEVGSLQALLDTTYGRLLIAKIALFVLVLGVAAVSRNLVRRWREAARPEPLRRALWLELAVAAVVLGVTATLVQTTPARTAGADVTGTRSTLFTTTLTSPLYSLQVEMDPAESGNNTLHMYAYSPDNRPQPVVEWRATIALPSAGIEPIEIPLLPLTDNHVTGETSLPASGEWQLRVTVRTSEIDQATVTATVPVR